jgi:hypothetical protein
MILCILASNTVSIPKFGEYPPPAQLKRIHILQGQKIYEKAVVFKHCRVSCAGAILVHNCANSPKNKQTFVALSGGLFLTCRGEK